MKIKFFIFISIFLLSTPTYCEIINARNLIKKEGLFYNKITKKLFTGLVEFQYGNGKLRAKGSLKKGKEEGYWEDYNEDGTLFSKGNYINGSPSGDFKFYHENGILEEEGKFIFGKKEGKWNTYWDNGNIKRQGIWKNGKATGLFKFFNSDAKIIKIEIWKNGKLVKRIFEINMENISFKIN
jgi:antitoxin component YwqK of YwqJK toxin-antitoxin module